MRSYRRAATSAIIAGLALILILFPASAGRSWCRADPVIGFGDAHVRIWVEIPAEYESLVTGPIEFEVTHPGSLDPKVHFTDNGFNGHGERVGFRSRDVKADSDKVGRSQRAEVTIKAWVPLDTARLDTEFGVKNGRIPIRVVILDPAGRTHIVHGTNALATKSISVDLGTN